MSDNDSKSLVVVWRVSECEIRNPKAPEIEPVRLLLGLAIVVGVDPTELLRKKTPGYLDVLEKLLMEFQRIRNVITKAIVDAKVLGRLLR